MLNGFRRAPEPISLDFKTDSPQRESGHRQLEQQIRELMGSASNMEGFSVEVRDSKQHQGIRALSFFGPYAARDCATFIRILHQDRQLRTLIQVSSQHITGFYI